MKSTYLKFLLICCVSILLAVITKNVLHFDKLLYNSLTEKLTSNQIENYFKLQEKWQWVGYVFIPVFILVKTLIVSSTIYTAVFFFNKEKITFKTILNIILKAEFIFLLVPVIKTLWFYFFQINYTLEDLQYFFPFSTLNIIGHEGLEPWLIYPLQILNLFELAYIIYLSYQIGKLTKTNADNGFKIMMYSYAPTMLLWVCVVMFLTLSMS
jgi:hypothetical protein